MSDKALIEYWTEYWIEWEIEEAGEVRRYVKYYKDKEEFLKCLHENGPALCGTFIEVKDE
jgi:hypothetical protein